MTTPIDPTTANGRLSLYAIYEAKAGKPPTRSQVAAIYAVARAVLPEGYVAVPVDEIEKALEIMVWGSGGTSAEQDTMAYFHSLLPTEEAAR